MAMEPVRHALKVQTLLHGSSTSSPRGRFVLRVVDSRVELPTTPSSRVAPRSNRRGGAVARLEVSPRWFGLIRLTEVATTLLRRARRAQAVQVVITRTQPGDEENRRLLSACVDCHSRSVARRSFQIDAASALDGRSLVAAPFVSVCSSRAPPRRCSPFTFNRSHLDDVTINHIFTSQFP